MGSIKSDFIDNFWKWFSSEAVSFDENFYEQKKLEELDNWISKLGDFSWEIGPGFKEPNALTISPNGSEDLLEITKQIILKAPKISNWEFNYAKPPKQWNLVFDMEDEDGKIIQVDGNNWEYVLFKFPDNKFDVIVKATGLKFISNEDIYTAGCILIEGILGEEMVIKYINEIEVVLSYDNTMKQKASSIQKIRQHILDLLS